MNVRGERIIIFGDSLSHAGPDAGPSIIDLRAGVVSPTSAPGAVLGQILSSDAAAVRLNAKVGRSARSFLLNEDASSLLASDRTFRPTKVIVFLGTNDIDRGLDVAALAKTGDAMTQIRDAYRGMGAEVFAVGPVAYNAARYNAGAPIMLGLMQRVFGADHTLDARPLTDPGPRSGDGVHFAAKTAFATGTKIAQALPSLGAPATVVEPPTTSAGTKIALGALGVAGVVGLSWLALRIAKRAAYHTGGLARRRRFA